MALVQIYALPINLHSINQFYDKPYAHRYIAEQADRSLINRQNSENKPSLLSGRGFMVRSLGVTQNNGSDCRVICSQLSSNDCQCGLTTIKSFSFTKSSEPSSNDASQCPRSFTVKNRTRMCLVPSEVIMFRNAYERYTFIAIIHHCIVLIVALML